MRKFKSLLAVIIITFFGTALMACQNNHPIVGEWETIYHLGLEFDNIQEFRRNGILTIRRINEDSYEEWGWEPYGEDMFVFLSSNQEVQLYFLLFDRR